VVQDLVCSHHVWTILNYMYQWVKSKNIDIWFLSSKHEV
jgi:hypothetical protein